MATLCTARCNIRLHSNRVPSLDSWLSAKVFATTEDMCPSRYNTVVPDSCRTHLSGRVLLNDVIAPKLPVKQQSSCSAWNSDSEGLYTATPDQGSILEDQRGMQSCESCSHPESQALQESGKAAPAPHPSTLLLQCGPPHALLQRCPLHDASLPFITGHMRMWSRWSEPFRALTGKLDIKLDRGVVYSR